jgi:hypothetical protein
MSDDDDELRARRLAREDASPTATWLTKRLLPYGAVLIFLLGLGIFEDDRGIFIPFFATALFWGMGIARSYMSRQERLSRGGTPAATPVATTSAVPDAVADIEAAVARVVEGLRRHGRDKIAGTVERGLAEVVRLATLTAVIRPEDLTELRTEIANLRAQAEAAPDPETAALWTDNASTAERRLEKLSALDAAAGRNRARIEAFRQAVKSLAVDLARLDLAGADPASLPQVDEHAATIERDVEALVRTRSEMDRLERAPADTAAEDARRRQQAAQRTM